jgi:hypothetical protein
MPSVYHTATTEGSCMLYTVAFDTVAVAVCELYFNDPSAGHGAEQGVRLELRRIERVTDPESIFAAVPIILGRPLWRVDLLESVDHPGTLDRAHHHPVFEDWEPCEREFDEQMSADPVSWVVDRLAGLDRADIPAADHRQIRNSLPEIRAAIERLLAEARAGGLANEHRGEADEPARVGWL